MSSAEQAYAEPLPPPGLGYHTDLMRKANYAAILGMNPEDAFADLRQRTPMGNRPIPDREITDALRKAYGELSSGSFIPRPQPKPIVSDGEKALRRIIAQATVTDEADLWEASPIRLMGEPTHDTSLFLETMFSPDDLVFIGGKYDIDTIKRRNDWINTRCDAPYIIINPLSGHLAATKNGDGQTYRGDHNVTAFRYCLVEFDNLSREDQIRFWSSATLSIKALIDTGGKSIHAWLDVVKLATVNTLEQWDTHIRQYLYEEILKPLGVDGACSNPARLSRLPGHYRTEKSKYQRLLWLSPEGRPVA